VTEDNDIQSTEAFVRQVVDRIQGVIEAKLTPPQPTSSPVFTTAYPGINYQTPTFYPGPYTGISPNLVGYSAGQPQVNVIGKAQVNIPSQRNSSGLLLLAHQLLPMLMIVEGDVGLASQNNIYL